MSLARQHRERTFALQTASAPASGGGLTTRRVSTPEAQAGAQILMRLMHDLRRLKQIKSTEQKVAAKRTMLPEYRAWCDGQLEAGRMTEGNALADTSGAADVLPTMMVWAIDVGDYPRALELGGHVLRFGLSLPSRYQRDAATLLVEQIAEAALAAMAGDRPFELTVLEQVADLTVGIDMHDEVQAKLQKALGYELDRAARALEGEPGAALALLCRSQLALLRAQDLNPRAGTKTKAAQVDKMIAAVTAATTPTAVTAATEQPGEAAG